MATTLEMIREVEGPATSDLVAGLEDEDTALGSAISKAFTDLYEEAIEKPARNVFGGALLGNASVYDLGENAVMLINKAGEYLTGEAADDTALGKVEAWLREAAETTRGQAMDFLDDDTVSMIYQGLGSAPAAIAEYATGAKALKSTAAGFAAVEALSAADEGPEAAAVAGAKGALLGGAFKATEGLKRLERAGALSAIGGVSAAAEGGDAREVTAGAATLGTLGVFGGRGRIGLKDIYAKPKPTRELIREIEGEARPTIEPEAKPAKPQGPEPSVEARPSGEGIAGRGAPLDPIRRQWGKAADRIIDYLAEGRLSPFARYLGGYPFKDPTMGQLPERTEYLGRRGEAQGDVDQFNRMANRLNESLRQATPEEQTAIFEYLTTKGANPLGIPERRVPVGGRLGRKGFKRRQANLRNVAIASKGTIKRLGKILVNRGLLSEEAYRRHADEYLPRVYLKYLLERTPFTTGLKLSPGDYTKARIENLPEEYRDLWLGEIRDPGFLVTKAVSVPGRDLALQDFLRDLTESPNWVLPKSLVDWTPPGLPKAKKVTPFWLKAEADALIDRAHRMTDPESRTRALEIAGEMRAVADKALGDLKRGVPEDFKQMPDTPRYGDLRGLVVRKEIFNDIVGESGVWIGEKGLYERGWDKLGTANAIWKMMKVPFNPPTQARNFVSNGVLLHLSGVPMARLPLLYQRALKEITHNGKHYRVALKHGIPASTFAAEELIQIMPDVLRIKAQKTEGVVGSLWKISEPLAKLGKGAGDLYQFSETWGKTVKIIDAMERQGMTERQAVAAAQEALFDYTLVPPMIRALRSRPIGAPFITFYYKAFPAVAKATIRSPGKMAMYYAIPYLLGDALLASFRDVSEQDVQAMEKALPDFVQESGHVYVFPYKDESGRWDYVNFGYFLPWAMHERTLKSAWGVATGDYEGSAGELASEFGILGGPVPQAGAALLTGIDPFTQRPIVKDTDPPKIAWAKRFNFAWRMAGPSWLTDQGVAGHMYRSLTGQPNYYGDPPLSVPQAAARMFGVNIYPVDPTVSRQRTLRRMSYEIKEVMRAGQGRLRDRRLSKEDKADIRRQYKDTVDRLKQRRKEYEEESRIHPNLR